eukprot:scaffold13853_cov147-Amphora_coffeaeformis.AAC.5
MQIDYPKYSAVEREHGFASAAAVEPDRRRLRSDPDNNTLCVSMPNMFVRGPCYNQVARLYFVKYQICCDSSHVRKCNRKRRQFIVVSAVEEDNPQTDASFLEILKFASQRGEQSTPSQSRSTSLMLLYLYSFADLKMLKTQVSQK